MRSHIGSYFKERALGSPNCNICSENAAFQSAFCYKIGFGVAKDEEESQRMLRLSKRRREEFEREISKLKRLRHGKMVRIFRENKFTEMLCQGHSPEIDYVQHFGHNRIDRAGIQKGNCRFRKRGGIEHRLGHLSEVNIVQYLKHPGFWKKSRSFL